MKRRVQCINIRETMPDQVKLDKMYHIDTDTLYSDLNGDWYADVYSLSGNRLGSMKLSHFRDQD